MPQQGLEENNTIAATVAIAPSFTINLKKSKSFAAETESLVSYHTAEETPQSTSTLSSANSQPRIPFERDFNNSFANNSLDGIDGGYEYHEQDDDEEDELGSLDSVGENTPLLFNVNYDAPPDYSDTRYREILDGEDLLPTYEQVQRENGHADWGERPYSGDSVFSYFTFFLVIFIIFYSVDKLSEIS